MEAEVQDSLNGKAPVDSVALQELAFMGTVLVTSVLWVFPTLVSRIAAAVSVGGSGKAVNVALTEGLTGALPVLVSACSAAVELLCDAPLVVRMAATLSSLREVVASKAVTGAGELVLDTSSLSLRGTDPCLGALSGSPSSSSSSSSL